MAVIELQGDLNVLSIFCPLGWKSMFRHVFQPVSPPFDHRYYNCRMQVWLRPRSQNRGQNVESFGDRQKEETSDRNIFNFSGRTFSSKV